MGISPLEYIMTFTYSFLADSIAKEMPHPIKLIYVVNYQLVILKQEREYASLLNIFYYIVVNNDLLK